MMRLAYLVSQYPAVSHTFILREVRTLRHAGFDIHVASVNAPDRPDDALTAEERAEAATTWFVKRQSLLAIARANLTTLATHPLGWLAGLVRALSLAGPDLKRIAYHLCYFVEAVLVARWMQRHELAHLHVHFATPASTVALIACRIVPITFSLTVHGPDEFDDVVGYRLREKIAAASFVCCIGHYARSQVMRLSSVEHWDKLEVTPLGVDPAVFRVRTQEGAGRTSFDVLCVGRLVPAKGQHVLVAAIDELVREGRDVRLRLVGDGPDRASLEDDVQRRGLERRVEFTGALDADRVRELYGSASAFALASFAEGIPVVLMEAMASGLPCVTTRITGIPELIRDGVDGILVPPSDAAALAAALRRLIDDPACRMGLGLAGRSRILEAWNLERNTARLADVFRRRAAGDALASDDPVSLPAGASVTTTA
jgi:colanic acid/amylovoran biosynthesis glycosyltransferase